MRLEINSLKKVSMSFLFWNKKQKRIKKTEEREKEDKLENKIEDKKETEKQEDTKVEIPLQEEKQSVVQIPKKEEKVNDLIKRTIERERKNYLCYKKSLSQTTRK